MDISDVTYGDRIINQVTGLLNPALLGSHIVNICLMITHHQTQQILEQPEPDSFHPDDRLTKAVRNYFVASSRVNALLRDPCEMIDLAKKYGRENFTAVRPCAEKYLDAARDLLLVMRDVTAADNPSREWVERTFEALRAPIERDALKFTAKPPRLALVTVEGEWVEKLV